MDEEEMGPLRANKADVIVFTDELFRLAGASPLTLPQLVWCFGSIVHAMIKYEAESGIHTEAEAAEVFVTVFMEAMGAAVTATGSAEEASALLHAIEAENRSHWN